MGLRLVASRPFDRAVAVAASGATGKAREKTLVKAHIRGQRINLVGGLPSQEYSFVSLYMKNLMSVTPLNCVLKALIFALNDSADALVRRCSK